MDRLEAMVASFGQFCKETIAELRQGQAELSRNMEQGQAELSRNMQQGQAELRRSMEEGQAESRRGMDEFRREMQVFKEEMRAFREQVQEDIAGMQQWRIQSQKQWGELAQKLGTFVEDIVAQNIPRVGREIFGLNGDSEALMSAARLRVWHPADRSRMREFDYIYAARTGWIVVESKNDPKLKDIDIFREMLAEVKEYFPQYASLRLFPLFASLCVPDHVVKYCTRHRIYAMGLAADTMQVLNLAEIAAETTGA